MYLITKEFEFSSAHQLHGLPEDHKCSRLHGHNYKVVVELQAPATDENGFVVDFGDLKDLKNYLDAEFDHRNLNDHPYFKGAWARDDGEFVDLPTTAENLALVIFTHCRLHFEWGPYVSEIRVSETPKTWAIFRENI
jgi:6-pyruvoyltetrahydropterin/6-carboxytetrahydropterin synthase